MIFNVFKPKPTVKITQVPWLDDCYNSKLNYYNLPNLVMWFRSITNVRWDVNTSISNYVSCRSKCAGELITGLNRLVSEFEPRGKLDKNLAIVALPLDRVSQKTLYEYFTYHDEREFHPTEVAIGLATLIELLNNKLEIAPEEYQQIYQALVLPVLTEICLVARVMEDIYEK